MLVNMVKCSHDGPRSEDNPLVLVEGEVMRDVYLCVIDGIAGDMREVNSGGQVAAKVEVAMVSGEGGEEGLTTRNRIKMELMGVGGACILHPLAKGMDVAGGRELG